MSHAENVREFYRRQGEARERNRILRLLAKVIDDNGKDSWLDVLELIKYRETGEENATNKRPPLI